MTVRELIEKLEEIEVNQDAEVFIVHLDWQIKRVDTDNGKVIIS